MYEDISEEARESLVEELIASIPKWIDIAVEFNDSLNIEEYLAPECVDYLSHQMMILKGTQMIQQGNSLIEAESNTIITHLVTTKQLDSKLKQDLQELYKLYKGNPSTDAEFWINDPNRGTI